MRDVYKNNVGRPYKINRNVYFFQNYVKNRPTYITAIKHDLAESTLLLFSPFVEYIFDRAVAVKTN